MVQELIFRFTPDELDVLQALIDFHSGAELPEHINQVQSLIQR